MGHAKEIITMDVYGDNQNMIADCADEIQPFVDDVMPDKADPEENLSQEWHDIVIDTSELLYAS